MYTGQLLFPSLSQSTDSIMLLSFWQTEEEECERGKQQGTKVEAAEETAVVASVSLFTVSNFVQLLTPLFGKRAAGTTCLWSACAALERDSPG